MVKTAIILTGFMLQGLLSVWGIHSCVAIINSASSFYMWGYFGIVVIIACNVATVYFWINKATYED